MPKRILVVDDEPWIVNFLGAHLIAAGYDVQAAQSGEEALQAIRQRLPDAVVLDLMLPGMDGAAVAEHMVHELGLEDIPVLFLSGLVSPSQAGTPANPRHYFLGKPIVPEQVFQALSALGL